MLFFCCCSGGPKEIERAVYSGILVPSADWHSLSHESPATGLRLTSRVRVQCDAHSYNATCMKLCRPRDDKFGHYVCDEKGDKACRPGWTGANCETGPSAFIFPFVYLFSHPRPLCNNKKTRARAGSVDI